MNEATVSKGNRSWPNISNSKTDDDIKQCLIHIVDSLCVCTLVWITPSTQSYLPVHCMFSLKAVQTTICFLCFSLTAAILQMTQYLSAMYQILRRNRNRISTLYWLMWRQLNFLAVMKNRTNSQSRDKNFGFPILLCDNSSQKKH